MTYKSAVVHYRIGKTDGVSLEIANRKKILEKLDHEVILISGPRQSSSNYIIPELEFDELNIIRIKENAFIEFKDYANESELINHIYETSDTIENAFLKIHSSVRKSLTL